MWDSFESESSSEDGVDDGNGEDQSQTSRKSLEKRRASKKGRSISSSTTSNHRHNNRRSSRSTTLESDGTQKKTGIVRERTERRKKKTSYGGGKGGGGGSQSSADSETHHNSSTPKIRTGDKVVVYLPSGGKAKGVVSVESSRDRYEITLENGEVEKRVHSRNIALASKHRSHRRNRSDQARSSSSRSQAKKNTRRRRESRADAPGREQSHGDESGLEPESRTPREQRSNSSWVLGATPPSSAEALVGQRKVGEDDQPVSLPSTGPSTVASAASGGGDPIQPPPVAESHSPDTAPTRRTSPPPVEALVSESERETSNGERGSSLDRGSLHERGSSPLSSKVRQAQGLLKTMFWRKGEEQGGGGGSSGTEGGRSASRRWSRGNSLSRRFSGGSGDDPGENVRNLNSVPVSGDETQRKKSTNKLDSPIPTSEHSEDAAASTPLGAAALKGHARRLSRGLTRGRSRNRNDSHAGAGSASPATSRSPSLATKLGMTLRGAIMGKTQLGVHNPHAADVHTPAANLSDADAGSDATYSTGASSAKRDESRRERRASRPRGGALLDGGKDHGGVSSDGFDSDIFRQDSPMAATAYGGDPRNLPDAVYSYIGAREKMEHEMSASGPVFLPRVDNLAAKTVAEGAVPAWGKLRGGSLDITKQASSTTQRTEQHQPFTEAMFKAGVSETRHSTKQGILLEGDLQKFSPESMRGVRWHKRYFVLYACACELRYYRTHAEAAWGRIPLGERGSIPLRLVVKIEQPSDKKYRGCRFDLVVLHKGESRHPGLHIRPGQESRVRTTKTFKFNAADAQQRLLWVTVIEALMKRHGWGMDADRCRSMRAPRHGGLTAGAGDSLAWGNTWGGGEAEGTEPAVKRHVSLRLNDGLNGAEAVQEVSSPLRADHRQQERSRKGSKSSVMNFVEDRDDGDLNLQQGPHHQQNDEEMLAMLRGTTSPAPQLQQRGLSIPYSPGGKRGSLTTGALSPPMPFGGARRQSSLKSDHLRW
ncbi:conserved unknown protein [Ectocarpus siliculosus]|uniref:PH domain-containing protein n=1 Tax=Ectocarpus siliculosus TaxID=2880 RepID=D8LL02_ECTSI|nr:conserved unknown protein [Ectocarpus siliculosus]|eukprot:CBN80135.1 conserved unknown protein [Ectocarpus siliculosus]